MKITLQEFRIIATGPCIANQLRDENTLCRRRWYIAAHVWKIYDFKIEVRHELNTYLLSKKIHLVRSLKKFIFRYQYLVEIYSVSADKIISNAF
jgi:hypothetical protein